MGRIARMFESTYVTVVHAMVGLDYLSILFDTPRILLYSLHTRFRGLWLRHRLRWRLFSSSLHRDTSLHPKEYHLWQKR
jgi:hypothetical protein